MSVCHNSQAPIDFITDESTCQSPIMGHRFAV